MSRVGSAKLTEGESHRRGSWVRGAEGNTGPCVSSAP